MLVIRLFRVGKKNQPAFKIVVADKRNPAKAGRFVEELGFWNPLTKERVIKTERVKYWLSVGAKPSATIYNLLVVEKILNGKKIPKHKKSKKKEGEKSAAEPIKPAAEPVKKETAAAPANSGETKEGEKDSPEPDKSVAEETKKPVETK